MTSVLNQTIKLFKPDHKIIQTRTQDHSNQTIRLFKPDHKIIQTRPQDYSNQTTRLFRPNHKIIQTRPQDYLNQFKLINQELSIQPAYTIKLSKIKSNH